MIQYEIMLIFVLFNVKFNAKDINPSSFNFKVCFQFESGIFHYFQIVNTALHLCVIPHKEFVTLNIDG